MKMNPKECKRKCKENAVSCRISDLDWPSMGSSECLGILLAESWGGGGAGRKWEVPTWGNRLAWV